MNRLVEDLPLHNLPVGWRIAGALDAEVLGRALGYLAERHSALRTRFGLLEDGSAFQDVLPAWRPELTIVPIPAGADSEEELRAWREATASRPFRLTEEPPFRASLARLGPDDHALLLVFHHIAFDGWSYGVVVRDLGAAYVAFLAGREPELPPLPMGYAEYAISQRDWVQGAEADAQRVRWAELLAGTPSELDLPLDRSRPAVPSYRVARHRHVVAREFRAELDTFAAAHRATPFTIFMAAFQALLGRSSGQDDFLVGFPLANRQDRADLRALVGCFINILLLRADLSGDPGFLELVRRVQRAAFATFPYQKLPFDEVAKVVRPDRILTQIQFNYRDYANPPLGLGDLCAEELDYDPGLSAVELSLDMIAFHSGALVLEFEYSIDLFDRSTVARLGEDYERLLRGAISAPEKPLSALYAPAPATTRADRRRADPSAGRAGAALSEKTSDVERTLLPLWEEVLGVAGIGRHDDFFDLGGQSLMAVHLVAELELALGGKIPLGWIFEHPTVARFAEAIESRPPQPFEGPEFLVPIRATGSLPPLFCVHGVGGGVFAYREAARLLGSERPVWGIMLVGRPIERIPGSVEGMAERYLEEIRTVQSEGPYSVIGYSFGCLVAYEMACRLAAGGEKAGFVGLVTPPEERTLASRFRRLRVQTKRILARRSPTITTLCLRAAAAYRPRPYPGRIVFFRARGAEPGRSEDLWRRLALGGLDVRTVPGEHLTIMRSDNATAFAGELRTALSEVETPSLQRMP